MKAPRTRYAKSGNVQIAYQVVGQGPLDLVLVPGFLSNLEVHWEDEGFSRLLQRLATFTRLIQLDKRGTGLSDRVDANDLPSLETRMDDVRAVMDAAGSGRAALLGASEGAPMSILFAATYPERTRALVLYGGYAHFHTWVMGPDALANFVRNADTSWGSGATLPNFAPGRVDDARFQAWWARFERLSASPTAAVTLAGMNAQIDVRHVLASIRVPTLVMHRRDDARVKFAAGRYLAENIKGARFVELSGRDHPIWTGDIDGVVDEIEEFLTGARSLPDHNRVLATLLVARLVAPERLASRLGDRRWSERIDSFRGAATDAIVRHGGQRFGTGVNEICARFDGSARAVRGALALRDVASALDLDSPRECMSAKSKFTRTRLQVSRCMSPSGLRAGPLREKSSYPELSGISWLVLDCTSSSAEPRRSTGWRLPFSCWPSSPRSTSSLSRERRRPPTSKP